MTEILMGFIFGQIKILRMWRSVLESFEPYSNHMKFCVIRRNEPGMINTESRSLEEVSVKGLPTV